MGIATEGAPFITGQKIGMRTYNRDCWCEQLAGIDMFTIYYGPTQF
jgi:hypothetical protein